MLAEAGELAYAGAVNETIAKLLTPHEAQQAEHPGNVIALGPRRAR